MPPRLPQAWRATYGVRLRDPSGFVTVYHFDGSCSSEQFEFIGSSEVDSEIVAHVKVTSWHPYEADALPDCLRAARDLCNILSIAMGQFGTLELVGSPTMERLQGAKDMPEGGRIRLSGSATARVGVLVDADTHQYRLEAAERVGHDPQLRADLDTYSLAMEEGDGPTRLIHYYRIYEREAQALMDEEPQLLNDEEIERCAKALAESLPERLTHEEKERLERTVRGGLERVRDRSRPNALADRLSKRLDEPIEPKQIRVLDSARGKYAHRSTEVEHQPDPADEEALRGMVWTLLRGNAGIPRSVHR